MAALHVGFFYVMSQGLSLRILPAPEPDRIDVQFLPRPERLLPPVERVPTAQPQPIPDLSRDIVPPIPDFEIPEPEVVLPPVIGAEIGITGGGTGASAQLEPPLTPVRAAAPLTQPPYPPAEIRNGTEGAVELAILVLRDGRIAEVKVARSSGSARLDRAAVEEARRNWRLRPAMRGGEPVEQWGRFRVVFRLEQR